MPRFTYSYDVHNTVYVRKTVAFYMYQEIILCNESICCSVLAATKCVTNVSFPVNPPPVKFVLPAAAAAPPTPVSHMFPPSVKNYPL